MTTPREPTPRANGLRFRALAWPEPVGRAVGRFAAEFAGTAGCPASREAP